MTFGMTFGNIVGIITVITTISDAFYVPEASPVGRRVSTQASVDGESQVLRFIEPKSGRPVVLVGAMHYNPQSISLSEDIVKGLAESRSLEAVVLESCSTRWEKGEELRAQMTESEEALYSAVFENEMQAAAAVAEQYDRPIILGDQPIEITDKRIKQSVVATLKDLTSPLNGGWSRIADDTKIALGVLTGTSPEPRLSCEAGLTLRDFFDFSLVISSPVSMLRYPLSIFVRYPVFALNLVVLLLAVTFLPEFSHAVLPGFEFADNLAPDAVSESGVAGESVAQYALSVVSSLAISAIETAVFGRILLNPILAERNVALADSIVEACSKPGADERTVVAILGMAHCNGVKGLIEAR
uniref:TraB family protein n=1 Tax=Octactis speculum TaxID=3111310 RepID=A0A7S2B2C4_9STRA|mmetsp:Transcript_18543/g.25161  ORF Transcript_18543/g.25161 Transcript_18543/m.25161 type:complete len:356 (+) Transcript_18543:25-1092(+)